MRRFVVILVGFLSFAAGLLLCVPLGWAGWVMSMPWRSPVQQQGNSVAIMHMDLMFSIGAFSLSGWQLWTVLGDVFGRVEYFSQGGANASRLFGNAED